MKDKNCTTDIFTNSFCQRKWLFHNLGGKFFMPVDSLPSAYPARPYIWHFSIFMPIYMTFDSTIIPYPPLRAKALLTDRPILWPDICLHHR